MLVGLLFVLGVAEGAFAEELRTRNVVLVTADGLRHQELFSGADRTILEGLEASEDVARLRERFWRESARERRELLMPFFWKQLAQGGVVLGDRSAGSAVSVANPHRSSYPGYSEILTGRVLVEIEGNVDVQSPAETVLEIARRRLSLERTDVAAFTSWNHFPYIVEKQPGTIFVNAGYSKVEDELTDSAMTSWGELQFRMLTPWSSVRHNAVTEELALAFLKKFRPRVLFLAFDETDEWAHDGRYDRTLDAIQLFDESLERLWTTLQSLDFYREKTTLIVTTDHGRGRNRDDWTSHGRDVLHSEETWVAFLGPDTAPRGSVGGHAPVVLRQVAPTILKFLHLDPIELGQPIEDAFGLSSAEDSRR
jgi:hypothetical protein